MESRLRRTRRHPTETARDKRAVSSDPSQGRPAADPIHDLRHANASLLLTAHLPMEILSKLVGHSNPTTKRNIYAHELKPVQGKAQCAQAGILTGS